MKKIRIAIINTHPIQYFTPLYAYLSKAKNLDITVIYCSNVSLRSSYDTGFRQNIKWNINLLEGYTSLFLGKNYSRRKIGNFFSIISPEICFEISKKKYDVVWLHGYNFMSLLLATLTAKVKNIPILFRCETHDKLIRSYLNKKLHYFFISKYFKLIDAFLSIGSANKQYYQTMKISKNKIFDVPYTIDNSRFINQSKLSVDERKRIKEKLKIKDNLPIILFASKFISRKNPEDILLATNILNEEGFQFSVIMVGDGPMKEKLIEMKKKYKLNNVYFPGVFNQSELPKIYAIADIFTLPSENEPWGIVINEAMCAGLAIITGDKVGSSFDLVKDDFNGYRFSAKNIKSLSEAIKKLISDKNKINQMKKNSFDIIHNWNFEKCKEGLLESLSYVLNK